MEKEFVPYELAVKLKELGFDEKCFSFYWNTPSLKHHKHLESGIRGEVRFDQFNNENRVSAPLWQQAFDWLLWKLKHLSIDVIYSTAGWELIIEKEKVNQYDTKEECLEKLIELCQK